MSRPKKATADYFPHFADSGKTLFIIEEKYKNEGYAFWFKLLELLCKSEHHYIDCNDISNWEFLLAITRFNEQNANDILSLLSNLDSIDKELWQNKIIRSNNLILNLSELYKRREINVISNYDLKELLLAETPLSVLNENINPQSKEKESKEGGHTPEKEIKGLKNADEYVFKVYDKNDESKEAMFSRLWKYYDKKVGMQKAWNAFKKLNEEERKLMKEHLKNYIPATEKDKQFRKHLATYINQKSWNDEIISQKAKNEEPNPYR